MAKEKRERTVVPPVIEYDARRTILYAAVNPLNKAEAFAIAWPVPQMADGLAEAEAECKTRYGVDLQYLVNLGIRGLATRPDYQESGFEFEDTKDEQGKVTKHTPVALKANGHAEMQGLADGYQPGRTASAGVGIKAKAAKADVNEAAAKALGFTSIEDMIRMAKELGMTGK